MPAPRMTESPDHERTEAIPPDEAVSSKLRAINDCVRNNPSIADELTRFAETLVGEASETGERSLAETAVTPGATPFTVDGLPQRAGDKLSQHVGDGLPHRTCDAIGTFGDYEILEKIAQGGMGIVYKARQSKLNRIVALKRIRSADLADADQIRRFYAEAEAAAKLNHPGIVPVYDVGEVVGEHFFSMAFVDGESLSDRVKRDGPLQGQDAARCLQQAADAVQVAHDAGIVHRDIKPANLLIDRDDKVQVTDFGLAKLQQSDSELTREGQVLGTPAYMPPEQADGRHDHVGEAADIYSLGATLYFLLTGRPPFQAATLPETLKQVIENEPVAPRKLDPSIPKDLETICGKCLRKVSPQRYASARELAEDLRRWLQGEPIQARPVGRVEQAWMWCKRKPVVAGLTAAIILGVVIGTAVFWERQNAARTTGLVESLAKAEPTQVPAIIEELDRLDWWAEPRLRKQLSAEGNSPAARRTRLHARIALADTDPSLADALVDDLLSADFRDIGNLRDALRRCSSSRIAPLWEVIRGTAEDPQPTDGQRLRAGLALAGLDAENDRWNADDHRFLVDQLVATDAFHQPEVLELLQPICDSLLEPLEVVFVDDDRNEFQRVAAANAIAEFAGDDAKRLSRLLLRASAPQFKILFRHYQHVAETATRSRFEEMLRRQPTLEMGASERIVLGQERADSAITLVRLGERSSTLDVLRFDDDPEALTQFVHRCQDRGVTVSALVELFELVDQRRGSLGDERQKVDDNVMYGLLLALGEFAWDDLPATRDELVERLEEVYQRDPSSGVHSATGWLLRQWGQQDFVDQVDRTPLPYDPTGHREWFVRKIVSESGRDGEYSTGPKSTYLTFIVFQPAEFTMGTPDDEQYRQYDETQHQVKFTRHVAVCDRELMWAQWMAWEGTGRRDTFAGQTTKILGDNDPVFGVSWFDSVAYCRWLSEQDGLSEDEQCYEHPSSLPKDGAGNPTNWPLRLDGAGFRLPTEAEWEFICRSGTSTAYSFGQDEQLLDHYAWHQTNFGDWSHPTRELRPNPRGLFDIHGNVYEWNHDWYNQGELSDATDPNEAEKGFGRVFRGGSWSGPGWDCRSSNRSGISPGILDDNLGFRLAIVPH